jgi:peptide chain release factor 2
MYELKQSVLELQEKIALALKSLDLEEKSHQADELEQRMQQPDFWNDAEKARGISQQANFLRNFVDGWKRLAEDVKTLPELFEMTFSGAGDEPSVTAVSEFQEVFQDIKGRFEKLEMETFLNGKYDKNNVIMSIHAGTGGKDAQDFAEILLRMYVRFCERRGFSAEILERSDGEEVGIKSVTLLISGLFAYGYLKSEHGVHRLVRQSPFNSAHSRETSFVLVEIMPDLPENADFEIEKDDLRIDVYRSGGAGGQGVNRTDSAVRLTHLPTGLVVACQTERSQLQNRERAMKILKSRLVDLMEKQQAATLKQIKGGKIEMSWGNQIRSYVLHPYKMVKDHRTDYEVKVTEPVLDGDIDGFIEAFLKMPR